MKYHQKHVEQLTDLNKLYSVASCWIIIAILYDARSTEHKMYFCSYSSLNFILFSLLFDVLYDIYLITFYFDSICLFSLTFSSTTHVFICFSSHFIPSDTFFSIYPPLFSCSLVKLHGNIPLSSGEFVGKKLPISLVVFLFCSRLLFYEVKRVYRITDFLTLFSFLINWNVLFVS